MTTDQLTPLLQTFRSQRQKIVLVTGVFDILHREHENFLRKAKQTGDVLLVGVESDVRVRQIKGKDRPINSLTTRMHNLENLNIANVVFDLPEQFSQPSDHERLVQRIQPDVLAISSHTAHQAEKRALVEKYGGKLIVVHKHNPEVSSTTLLNNAHHRT